MTYIDYLSDLQKQLLDEPIICDGTGCDNEDDCIEDEDNEVEDNGNIDNNNSKQIKE